MVIGEGAGVVIAEDLDHAKRRGARIYGEVLGFGSGFDSRNDGRGIAIAVRAALDQAGINPDSIDHVHAHGLSTSKADRAEAKGLREVFGARKLPVFAGKSFFGHLGGGGVNNMA
jgi:3-oxoacyl-[acyl-carrier-protein] synthase II